MVDRERSYYKRNKEQPNMKEVDSNFEILWKTKEGKLSEGKE